MENIWSNFENWLKSHFEDGLNDLNEPINDIELYKLEKNLGIKLPTDFKSFLRVHNGQKGEVGGLINACELLSSERILDEWTVWKGLLADGDFDGMEEPRTNGIKPDWWNLKWIPFTYDGSGNHLCIDLDPSDNGINGQIITMWHDDEEREVVAASFQEWFKDYVNSILNGKYVYIEKYKAILDSNDI